MDGFIFHLSIFVSLKLVYHLSPPTVKTDFLSYLGVWHPDLPPKTKKDITLYGVVLDSVLFGGIIPVGFHFETGFRSAAVLEITHCCVGSLPFSIVWSRELRTPRTVLHPAQSTEQGGLSQQPTVVWRWGLWLVSTHNAKLSLIRPGI